MMHYLAGISSHWGRSGQYVSGWDKRILKDVDVSFPIQPSLHVREKANTSCINASPDHDPTDLMQLSLNSSELIHLTYIRPSLLWRQTLTHH